MNRHTLAKNIKKLIYYNGEPYTFASQKLLFKVGTRPHKRKYRSLDNDVVANDVLQIDFFEQNFKESDVLWDIGSHHGHYSIFAAAVTGKPGQVFSFEPDAKARNTQVENIELNGFSDKVRVFDFAISDVDGTLRFRSRDGDSTSSIVKTSSGAEAGVDTIQSRTVASLLNELPAPTFVKIDTEGAEIDILLSAGKLLENKNIKFICELHPFAWESFGVEYRQLTNLLASYGREISVLDTRKKVADLPFYGTILF